MNPIAGYDELPGIKNIDHRNVLENNMQMNPDVENILI